MEKTTLINLSMLIFALVIFTLVIVDNNTTKAYIEDFDENVNDILLEYCTKDNFEYYENLRLYDNINKEGILIGE